MTMHSENVAKTHYVHRIDELREEIRLAMEAISGNQPDLLAESICRQELLCIRLKQLVNTVLEAGPGPELVVQLRDSFTTLRQMNQTYTEVLRQAKSSNDLLYALYQGVARYSQEPPRLTAEQYSLEV